MRFGRGIVFAACCALLAGSSALAQDITRPPDGDNQHARVTQWIGLVKVEVDYHSPDVHGPGGEDRAGRIWGELVPYGLHDLGFNDCKTCPWRAGANENTVFTVSHDVRVEGQPLKAGSYGLHMIAGKDEWTVIFSRNSTSWGSFTYDPAEDALRVTVKPEPCEYHEWLTYEFTDRQPDKATVALKWERLAVPIHVTVPDIADLYVAQMDRELRGNKWFTWTNWEAAARYCLQNRTHLDQGLRWAQHAVNGEFVGSENFATLGTLGRLQIANGKKDDAAKTIERALAMPGPNAVDLHQFARGLQQMGENAIALRVFEANAKRHPNQWPVTLGLARGYFGIGDPKRALPLARQALKQAPDAGNRQNVENFIKTLEAQAAK